MAKLDLQGYDDGFSWQVYELGNPFIQEYYICAGVTENDFQDGTSSISGVISTIDSTISSVATEYDTGHTWVYSDPGTYRLYGFAQAANGRYYKAGSGTVTVGGGSVEPTIYVDYDWSTTSNSITVYVEVDSDAPYYRVFCRRSNESEATVKPSSGFAYHDDDFAVTFSGLDPSTHYVINVQYSTSGYSDSGEFVGSADVWTQEETTPSIAKWDWSKSNATSLDGHTSPASAATTYTAYEAITGQGPVSDFDHHVWNDMCCKCKEILTALDYEWEDNYLIWNNTLMKSGDTEMTAARFNSLRFNIGSHFTVSWNFDPDEDIQPGKPIMGYYFTELTDKLNAWIDDQFT